MAARRKKARPKVQYDRPIGPEPEGHPDTALRESICSWVREGVKPKEAALVEGIYSDEFEEWLRSESRSCRKLRLELMRAEATAEATVVGRIKVAAKTDWKAAAWLAERNWPERYQRRSIQGDDAPRAIKQEATPDDPFSELDNVVEMRSRDKP